MRTIFGDGASATVLSKITNKSLSNNFKSDFGTNGSGYKDLIVPSSGLNKIKIFDNDRYLKSNFLHMNGKNIFLFALNTVPISIKKTALKNKISLKSMNFFILHQANNFILEALREKLKLRKINFILI